MSINPSNQLPQLVEDVRTFVDSALSDQSAASFEALEQQVNRFDAMIREWQQSQSADEVRAAIRKLEKQGELSEGEMQLIRRLIVGDAESYLRQENNLNDWLKELQRLSAAMQTLAGRNDPDAVNELRGIVRDAVRLLPNIRSYMEEKERVDHFRAATEHLDQGNRALLADLLREMLSSATR